MQKNMQLTKLLILLIAAFCFTIGHAKELIEKDNEKCTIYEQEGLSSLALRELGKAKEKLHKTIELCPNKINAIFQLGVAYCLENNKMIGFEYMDLAIKEASDQGDDLKLVFIDEKKEWVRYFLKEGKDIKTH